MSIEAAPPIRLLTYHAAAAADCRFSRHYAAPPLAILFFMSLPDATHTIRLPFAIITLCFDLLIRLHVFGFRCCSCYRRSGYVAVSSSDADTPCFLIAAHSFAIL